MKNPCFYKRLLIAALGIFCWHAALASDGTITFNGRITANTCAATLNETAQTSSTLTLPTVSSTNLSSIGDVAATTQFDIHLANCTITQAANLTTYFEHGPTVNPAGRLSNDTGDSAGVDIQLLNADGAVINASKDGGLQGDKEVAMPTGANQTAILTYFAQYYRAGASITPGTVITHVDYTVIYD